MKPLSFAKLVIVCATAAVASGCSIVPSALGFDRMEVTAEFENVAGLYVGNEVAVLGLPVGTVEAIEPNGATATVTLSVDRKVKIPADAIAATVSPQLITNRHVELTPAYTGDGPTLAAGDHIPLQRTRTPVELDRILENFDRLGEALKGNNQDGPMASRVLYPLLNGNGDKLRETLDSLSSAFQVAVANKDQIANTLVKLNEITQIVAANDQTVRDFSGRITELVALLAEQAPGLRDVLAQLNDFIQNTSAVVGENREQLTGALTRLTGLTDQMRSNATNLTEIVDLTPLLFQNLDNAVSREHGALRLHALTDKSLLDGEALALFCERIQMRSDGCRTGKIADFGPDLGLTAALLGLTQ